VPSSVDAVHDAVAFGPTAHDENADPANDTLSSFPELTA
jgi:hypothetical protein